LPKSEIFQVCLAKMPSAFSFIAFHPGRGLVDRAAPNR
jgi:hypothetical protein